MDKLNFASIFQRIKAKTPPFWKRVRTLMITLGAVGAAIAALPDENTSWLPNDLANAFITIGTVGAVLSSLTANPEIDKK